MSSSTCSSNVLIIGAGPVGLKPACELARHGVPGVRIVEKRPGRTERSNALIERALGCECLKQFTITPNTHHLDLVDLASLKPLQELPERMLSCVGEPSCA